MQERFEGQRHAFDVRRRAHGAPRSSARRWRHRALGAALTGTLALTAVVAVGLLAGSAPASADAWNNAQEVPNASLFPASENAAVASVSCAPAGDCSAGGYYTDLSGHQQAFVATETGGVWGDAEEVPGTANLNTWFDAEILSVSCTSAGNCSAGGFYSDGSSLRNEAFAVEETGGQWGNAFKVYTPADVSGSNAEITTVSCASNGNCSAGGFYLDGSGNRQAFVVNESSGAWGNGVEVPNTATLNSGGSAQVLSVSCASAGNCGAGGYVTNNTGTQAFVVNESGGKWGNALEVPNVPSLNLAENAQVDSVSCASAGNCSVVGYYTGASSVEAFAATESGGTWGNGQQITSPSFLTSGPNALTSVSCASAGNCTSGGSYVDLSSHTQAFVVSESGGTWGSPEEVPNMAGLNLGNSANLTSVSCPTTDSCSAGGYYSGASGHHQAMVVMETAGTWGQAEEVPGTAALNTGASATVNAVSCAAPGSCSAGGYYTGGHQQPFVVSSPSPQSITVTSTAPAGAVYGGSNSQSYTTAATSSSGLAVTLSIDPSSTSGCSVTGATVSYGAGAGTCVIDFDQAGNANYFAAPEIQQSFSIAPATQGITFSSTPPSGATYTGTNSGMYTVDAGASSGLPVDLSIDASSTSGCTISGGVVSYGAGAGTCVIDANQDGDANNSPAPQSQQSFSVAPAVQTIALDSHAPTNVSYSGSDSQSYPLDASASSGLAVTPTIDSSSTSSCSVVGDAVAFGGAAGTCVIDLDQAGDSNWLPAAEVRQSFVIAQAAPSAPVITNIPAATMLAGNFVPTVSTNGDGATSVTSSTPAVCAVDGDSVDFVTAGTCTLTAAVAAGTNYLGAQGSPQSFAVGVPTITGFSPGSGAPGAKVTITGTNLGDVTSVKIGGIAQKIKSDAAGQIVIKIVAGTPSGKIKVATPGGSVKTATALDVT